MSQDANTRMAPRRRSVVLDHLGSAWFLIPQGTGILAIILHQLDYQFSGLKTISVVFWITTMVLLLSFLIIYSIQFIMSPRAACRRIYNNITEAACLASISITTTSIIQMLSLVVVPSWGGAGWGMATYVLWWINLAMAVSSCLGLPLIFIRSVHVGGEFIKCLTPTTQLPMIAVLTSAAGAATIAQTAMLTTRQQVPMILVAYMEIGLGLPLALGLDVLFLARIFIAWPEQPGAEGLLESRIYTDMVLCGPWGQSSFALQNLGVAFLRQQNQLTQYAASRTAFLLSDQAVGPVAYSSMLVGLVVWGQGTFWWTFAVARISLFIIRRLKRRQSVPFGVTTWAIIFPWGVYTNAAVQLGKVLNSPAFKVWSTALAIMLVILWLLLAALTIRGVVLGTLLGHERRWRPKPSREAG